MQILWLFNTAGPIVASAIFLAALAALFSCLRASRWERTPHARRIAIITSLLPFAFGVCGAAVGLALFGSSGQNAWENRGKLCLAGLTVTAIPLLWAMILLRRQRSAT